MVRERESNFNSVKPILLNFVLPAGEAVSQPPLSALLGQVQINSNEFCKQFNSLSIEKYYPGTLLNVSVIKYSDNRFKLTIRGFSLPFLFFQASFNIKKRKIYVETAYDILKIICQDQSKPLNESSAREFFGALRTSKFRFTF
jgi:ribosomal protein L11